MLHINTHTGNPETAFPFSSCRISFVTRVLDGRVTALSFTTFDPPPPCCESRGSRAFVVGLPFPGLLRDVIARDVHDSIAHSKKRFSRQRLGKKIGEVVRRFD